MIVRRGKHFVHCRALGDSKKPALLLVMGLTMSARAWGRLPELLADDFRVVTVDNRGTGASSRRGWTVRMRDFADDAAAALDALDISQADVFGVSMGGMIALELALRHPSRVRRLALGATFAGFRTAHRAPLFGGMARFFRDRVRLGRDEAVARVLLSKEFHDAQPGRGARWLAEGQERTVRCAVAHAAAVVRHHTLPRLARIQVPTLVMTGDADELVPMKNSEVLARAIPGATLLVLKGAGHVFPLEREAETVAALRAHFANGNRLRSSLGTSSAP